MPIDRISIQNFKSIQSLNDFRIDSLNILVGANGVGKSNFISFFKLLNAIATDRLAQFVASNGYAHKILHFGKKTSKELTGSIVFKEDYDTNTNNRYDFELKPDQSDGFYFQSEKGGYNRKHDVQLQKEHWHYKELDSVGKKQSGLSSASAERFEHLRQYFRELKVFHFHDTSSNAPLRQPATLRDNLRLKEDGSNLAAVLYLVRQKAPAQFKLIEYAIRSVAPFFDKFNLQPDSLNPNVIFLSWLERGSDEYFDANHLSDGSLRFIALATALLHHNPPETIIIDEPELGLHPAAIQKLASLVKMAEGKSQIILSTQSVNLLEHFEPENIIVVDRAQQQSVFKRLHSADLEQWIEDYNLGELWRKNIIGGTP
jgi:predicted ATPase